MVLNPFGFWIKLFPTPLLLRLYFSSFFLLSPSTETQIETDITQWKEGKETDRWGQINEKGKRVVRFGLLL